MVDPSRISINGKVVDGQVVGDAPAGGAEEAKETFLGSLLNKPKEKPNFQQMLAEAIGKSMKLHQAEVKWGKPGSEGIEVRTSGIWRKQNANDLKRYEAAKATHDRGSLLGYHLVNLERFIASGKKSLLEVMEYLMAQDAELPAELRPLGEALTKISLEVLTGTFAEDITMLSQLGLEDIVRAFKASEI